jgi:lipopolysaccharide/colanic/teichoic acid biosynthesis glycosyltransferase
MRRMVDVVTALFLLGAAAPLLGLIAVAVKIGSPGPVLYAPLMVGQGGGRSGCIASGRCFWTTMGGTAAPSRRWDG